MGRTVILSVKDGDWNVWGERFVARQPVARVQRLMPLKTTVEVAKKLILEAINAAGAGGTLIFNVGHGGFVKGSPSEGKFELAPGGVMTIAGGLVEGRFVDVFYDVRRSQEAPSDLENDLKNNPQAGRLKRWRVYEEISAAFKRSRLSRVVLLVCNVGNAPEFLRKVANDWNTPIQAYKKQVGLQQFVGTGSFAGQKPIRVVFLVGDPINPKSPASDILVHEEEIPFNPAETLLIGPPTLPKP